MYYIIYIYRLFVHASFNLYSHLYLLLKTLWQSARWAETCRRDFKDNYGHVLTKSVFCWFSVFMFVLSKFEVPKATNLHQRYAARETELFPAFTRTRAWSWHMLGSVPCFLRRLLSFHWQALDSRNMRGESWLLSQHEHNSLTQNFPSVIF
jgi:hypothetical protein